MARLLDEKEYKTHPVFGTSFLDLVSAVSGGSIVSFSDEFFAEAENLINPEEPIEYGQVFIPTGKKYDGWETKRHNEEPFDWVILKLGLPAGTVHAVEVSTRWFNGNHAPEVAVLGAETESGPWETILEKQPCDPDKRHIWELPKPTKPIGFVKLAMYPDGGIARFRLYGRAVPKYPEDLNQTVDLASGGLVVSISDEHFGRAAHLLLPNRGRNMGDGWETKRTRGSDHTDHVVVRLGATGVVEEVVVDTNFFRGNYPRSVEVFGLMLDDSEHAQEAKGAELKISGDDSRWELLVPDSRCKAGTIHSFNRNSGLNMSAVKKPYSHVKMAIKPDGGVMRLRVNGKRVQSHSHGRCDL